MAEAAPTHTELRFRSPGGKSIRVQPVVDKVIIHEQTAVFTGMTGHLLTFDPPGPSVDVTSLLTERAVKDFGLKTNGVPFYTVLVASLKDSGGGVELGLATFLPEGDKNVTLSWEALAQMAQEAKARNQESDRH